jgi:hypothetical protein
LRTVAHAFPLGPALSINPPYGAVLRIVRFYRNETYSHNIPRIFQEGKS